MSLPVPLVGWCLVEVDDFHSCTEVANQVGDELGLSSHQLLITNRARKGVHHFFVSDAMAPVVLGQRLVTQLLAVFLFDEMTAPSQTEMSPLLEQKVLTEEQLLFLVLYLISVLIPLIKTWVLHDEMIKPVPPDSVAWSLKLVTHLQSDLSYIHGLYWQSTSADVAESQSDDLRLLIQTQPLSLTS